MTNNKIEEIQSYIQLRLKNKVYSPDLCAFVEETLSRMQDPRDELNTTIKFERDRIGIKVQGLNYVTNQALGFLEEILVSLVEKFHPMKDQINHMQYQLLKNKVIVQIIDYEVEVKTEENEYEEMETTGSLVIDQQYSLNLASFCKIVAPGLK